MLDFIISAKSPFSYKVNYSQIWGLGHEHFWRDIILPAIADLCPQSLHPTHINASQPKVLKSLNP